MTLNFSRTASDCAVVRALYPMVTQHFEFRYGQLVRKPTDYAPKWQRPGAVFQNLMFDLREFLPDGRYWDRTRHRLGQVQGTYLIRRRLFDYQDALDRGDTCLCGTTCTFPAEPEAS